MNSFLLALILLGNPLSGTASTDTSFNEKENNIVNINSQPEWGPTGYNYVEYYYIPDIETYYYVPKHQYIYLSNHKWTFSSLPPKYREVDLYNCYKVVLNEQKPFLRFKQHKEEFAKYKGQKQHSIIKNCVDETFNGCWKNTNAKCMAWEACTEKKTRRNLKRDL